MTIYNDRASARASNGLAKKAMDFMDIQKRLVGEAKRPGFTVNSLMPVAELVDVDSFVRVGPLKDRMDWQEFAAMLTKFFVSSEWEFEVKRVTEHPPLVFIEIDERFFMQGKHSSASAVSVWEFNQTGKLQRIENYLAREP